ncbi:Signal transduction histidine kinase [Collimonas sp. OK307]|uniref:ATP-binding response regulator n=1 Tax=Collimonas sp. OK307 TaxID=1801620 RepID=UPI0008F1FD4B|nr:hybrid sensor histidine kinase/response regulator [Collimonas sp. OK307]SFI18006.1 Signal transduction histidine kinase [Collimonas sp. OK307]
MRRLLRLSENRILVEQLRLLLGNVGSSVIPALLLAVVLVWALSNDSNALGLRAWCATVVLSKLYSAYHARRTLASGIAIEHAHRLVLVLLVLNMVDGAAWGALAWVTLGTTSVTGSILVVSVLAGIAGSSMSLLAPVLPVFILFMTFESIVTAAKFWHMGDPAYTALALALILFLITLVLQARNSAIAVRAAISLRFENVELLARLRDETLKVQDAHREAVLANLAKSKFLAAASHDLRQPIHALGLFLEVLARSELTAIQRAVLGSARSVSEASAGMLNTLLDFSRIEAGVVDAQVLPFHLQPLLHKIENELAPQANAKGLIYRTRETHVALQSDPALVELILRNLVSNAIRYSERGGVLVACRTRGNQTRLEVWDTGIGIEPLQHQEIFREFHQLGNAERDRSKGLGLGLAIADGLARKLGHELSLSSKPGRGSVFRLTLPNARVPVISDELETTHVSVQKLDIRVLVVDDDEAVRAGMLQLLHDWGCKCEAVESIEEALASARANRPDIVISDFRLRKQHTGAQAIAALREEFGEDLPALLITGDTAPERLRDARASGIPLLHKPVAPSQLHRRLASILADMDK